MSKLILALSFATLISVLAPSSVSALWRVGAHYGVGTFDYGKNNHSAASSGDITLIGASLTFPPGFYIRFDSANADAKNVTGVMNLFSLGWRYDFKAPFHIAGAYGIGSADLKDEVFSYNNSASSQVFLSAGYGITKSFDIALGYHHITSDGDTENSGNSYVVASGIPITANVVSLGVIYGF